MFIFLNLELILQSLAHQYKIDNIKLKGLRLGRSTEVEHLSAHYRGYSFELANTRIDISPFHYPSITIKSLLIRIPEIHGDASVSSQNWETDHLSEGALSATPFSSMRIDRILVNYAESSFELSNFELVRTSDQTTITISTTTRFGPLCEATDWTIRQLAIAAISPLQQMDVCKFPQTFLISLTESKKAKEVLIQSHDKFTLKATLEDQDLRAALDFGTQSRGVPTEMTKSTLHVRNLSSAKESPFTLRLNTSQGAQRAEVEAQGSITKRPLEATLDAGTRVVLTNFAVPTVTGREAILVLENSLPLSPEIRNSAVKVTLSTRNLKINSQDATLSGAMIFKDDKAALELDQFTWKHLSEFFRPFSIKLETIPDYPLLAISGSVKSGPLQATTTGTLNLAEPIADFSVKIPPHHLDQGHTLEDIFKMLPVQLNLNAGSISGNLRILSTDPFIMTTLSVLKANGEFYEIPFERMTTNLEFSALDTLRTSSVVDIALLKTPIPISDVKFFLALHRFDEKMTIRLNAVSGMILGGQLKLDRAIYRPFSSAPQFFEIQLHNIALEELMKFSGQEATTASGAVNISLPLKIQGSSISVEEGKLTSVGPGRISLPLSNTANGAPNQVLNALENFIFSSLSGTIRYEPTGVLKLGLKIQGKNPDILQGQQFIFNINIEQNLLKLLDSFKDPLKHIKTSDFSTPP